ncbi:MAG: hypothetical protein RI995_37 [Bacteroidota bacterium]
MLQKTAVIDLGTNTFQLLVAGFLADDKQLHIYENRTYAVSLGLGAMESGLLQEEAMVRACKALDFFSEIILSYEGIGKVTAIGTSIIRNAENGQFFLDQIQKRYGFEAIKISGQQEASLIFSGVVESMPQPWKDTSLIMDIGGGSTEFILFEGREVLFKGSYEIGGLKMLSLFHENGAFSIGKKEEMELYVLQQIPELLAAIRQFKPVHVIGAAGAFETLYDLEMASTKKPNVEKKYAESLSVEIFYQHKRLLEKMSIKERELFPGMKPFRAGILPSAMIEIDLILQQIENPSLWFSDFSLKEGYFFETSRNSIGT